MNGTWYYIVIGRKDGGYEYFRYLAADEADAKRYASDKAHSYRGRVATCRPSTVQ